MGTGTSSKGIEQGNDDKVRDRLNSGDFHKISPPSSPSIALNMTKDEMSYSGILVEKPEGDSPTPVSSATSASFAADLSTPPASNRSKNRTKTSAKEQPRRIVKATPPSSKVAVDMDDNRNDADSQAENIPSSLASPIGVNAASEMLEESIEKNTSKNKQRVTNKQKSDREKLLQEKRRCQQPNGDKKPQVQANPFSRFLSAFSVNTNPTHKRKESNNTGDPNKRLKYGFNDSATVSDKQKPDTADSSETEESEDTSPASISPWIAAASIATIAVLVFAVVRGSKRK